MKVQSLTVAALLQAASPSDVTPDSLSSLDDPSAFLDPDASILKGDDFHKNEKIDGYLNQLIRKIFPELQPVDEPTLQSIREKIDVAVNKTGVANITEIFNEMKDSQTVNYTIAKLDSSEYGGEYGDYPNSGGLNDDYWDDYFDPPRRGDPEPTANVFPFPARQAVVDKFIERKMVKTEVHGNKMMFTIDHSLSKSLGSTSSGEDTSEHNTFSSMDLFGLSNPESFWLVADLVIPDGLQKNDWWLVKVSDNQKETVEGFRIEGSLKRIVYAASSPKGNLKQQIVGASENGWDKIFDGKTHQIAVHATPRQIEFYYDCEKKGGAFLNNERRLPDNTSYKFAVNDEDGQKESIPVLFNRLEILSEDQAENSGICCTPTDRERVATCIIEGDFALQASCSQPNLPPPEIKCERGPPGASGEKGAPGSKGTAGSIGPKGEIGPVGKNGPKGERGPPGIDGKPGIAGIPGNAGQTGEKGEKGNPGEKGKIGEKGEVGEIGPSGLPGSEGKAGSPGLNGTHGLAGTKGEPGQKGRDGLPGILGSIGVKGEPGEPGQKGDDGPRGAPGAAGIPGLSIKGDKGENGERGPPGIIGDNGPMGFKGEPGPQGPVGEVGRSGEKGDRGESGPPGQPGRPGSAGPNGNPGGRGEPGMTGPQGFRGEAGKSGEPGIAGIKGPQGDTGPRGLAGLPGERGLPGPTGPIGPPGPQGPPGPPGERGGSGPDGPRGATGPRGPERSDSEVKKLILEVFAELIPTVIEPVRQECKKCDCRKSNQVGLARMRKPGPPGPAGRDGEPGEPGPPGPRGHQGTSGMFGQPGKNGLPGEKGDQGPSGEDIIGAPGAPGRQGPVGPPANCAPGEPGEPGPPGRPGQIGRDGPTGIRGQQGVCKADECKAPDEWAANVNNYAKLFQTTPAPWNKGPPPSRNDNAPAFQPDTVMRMPAKPEDSLLGPVRTEEAPPGLGIPDSVIPHLKGPTGERHTVNINRVPRPAVNPSGEQVWIPTTTSTSTTTTTTTTTTRRTTRQTTPRARKRPCYSCDARKKAQERLTTLAPKTVKPRPATVEPAIIAPAVSKCKLNERDENSPCKPSPCKSTWTVCKARVACKNAAAKKKQKCVVRRIQIIRNKRHQELIRAKRQKIKSSLKSKRSAKRKSRKIES